MGFFDFVGDTFSSWFGGGEASSDLGTDEEAIRQAVRSPLAGSFGSDEDAMHDALAGAASGMRMAVRDTGKTEAMVRRRIGAEAPAEHSGGKQEEMIRRRLASGGPFGHLAD